MHSLRHFTGLALAGLLLAVPAASSAEQGLQPQSAQPTPAAATGPISDIASTVLHTNANLVLVGVVVTERGNVVHGLDRSRFHVFEDGREQTIVSFDEHTLREESVGGSAAMLAALPPHTYSNTPLYPRASAVNVLLLDGLNTPIENQADVRGEVVDYLNKVDPGTSFAIFTLASQLQMIRGFTTDTAELTSAVENRKTGPQQSVLLEPQNPISLSSGANELVRNGNVIALIQQQLANIAAYQTDQRVRMTLDAMRQLARYLSAIPGRKNLIWFSGSFPIALDPNDQLISPFDAMRHYSNEVRQTSDLLSAARVAVYPVDARGIMTQTSADASYRPPPNVAFGRVNLPAPAKDEATFERQTGSEHASMEQIADATGGKAYTGTNDLKQAMENAFENGSSYYTIGYVPPAKPSDGEFRNIQLRMDGGGYSLAYRKGYYAAPTNQRFAGGPGAASPMVAAALHGAPPATQIHFKARLLDATRPSLQSINLPAGPAGEMAATLKKLVHRYVAELTVDPHDVAFDALPDRQHQANLEFAMVAYDANGRRINYIGRSIALNLQPAQFAQIMDNGIRVRMALDLPPGDGFIRIAAEDLAAGRAGSLEITVVVASK